jgi:hypothetical protein
MLCTLILIQIVTIYGSKFDHGEWVKIVEIMIRLMNRKINQSYFKARILELALSGILINPGIFLTIILEKKSFVGCIENVYQSV